MPKRNRVAPDGAILAVPDRGTFMGNRGILHDANGFVRRDWRVRRWLICELNFNQRRRTVMAANRYTELFFLDEATALAAGHRPCFECRRDRFHAFQSAMAAGLGVPAFAASGIDDRLHSERLNPDGTKRTFVAELEHLPDGVFVDHRGQPHLVSGDSIFAWTFGGYSKPRPRPAAEVVVLTPPSTVAALATGYRPVLHASVPSGADR